MKSAMEKAFDKVKSLNIQKLEEPKKSKGGFIYDSRPGLFLTDKELTALDKYKVGDNVILVIECTIKSISTNELIKDKKKHLDCNLTINSLADITKV